MVLNEKDFNDLLKDRSLMEAMLNPIILDESTQKSNGALIIPLIICDNPDTELPKVSNQVNFILPLSLRVSKEPYAINIKNDIKMYMILYEKHSKEVNEIIDKTKESLQKIYLPLKKLRDEIKIKTSVLVSAENIIIHRHPATLTNQLPRRPQKRID